VGSTLGDELRLQSGFRSKVIAVSHKDRAAILMAGRLANAAYWMRDSAFTTSSYYCDTLPAWVTAFNASGVINRYFGSVWERALSPNAYAGLGPDDAPWEDGADGMGVAFPHRITGSDPQHITRSYYTALIRSPFGSDALLRFAEAAVQGEQLGSRGVTDLLCISFSGTDYVGHAFGPLSHEVFDMAVRMDRTLAALFAFLDRAIGLDRCVIALSADHGVGPAPEALLAHAPGTRVGRLPGSVITQLANEALRVRFAALPPRGDLVAASQSFNLYLDGPLLTRAGVDTSDAAEVVAAALNRHPAVALALSARRLREGNHPSPLAMKMRRSFFEGRSGDVVYALKPYWYEDDDHTGASHGTPWEYDAHVPLLLFGKGIRPGAYASEASPVDLAPTLAALLGVEFTAGSDGAVLEQALVQPVPPAAR
jgi:predicted AlkP superfamily pyrophosphatase or phosphodiesterase